MRMIQVTLEDAAGAAAQTREVPSGTRLSDVAPKTANGLPVLAAMVNNDVIPLFAPLSVNSRVRPLTLDDENGWRVYRWSLCFLLAKAAHDSLPDDVVVRVRHAFGSGLFCTIDGPAGLDRPAAIAALEKKMRADIAADLPIELRLESYPDALALLEGNRQRDKKNLLLHRNPPAVVLADCGGFLDLFQEPMVDRTGLLSTFDLAPYEDGFVLRLPFRQAPHALAPLGGSRHLFNIYQEHIHWGDILGVSTVSDLNAVVMRHEEDELIRVTEALHDKKFADIAAQIAARPDVRLVLIAGPSSSGKTTSAKRLTTHLRVLGLRPVVVSTDDFFVGDERNPRDENGKLDYEHIRAMDLDLLNENLTGLLAGREVGMPRYDFKSRAPFPERTPMRLEPGQIIVMEGIHCLNPELTAAVPREQKFLVYVSALTQLGIDRCCRISTTDNRLLRRIVRDSQFRARPALDSLRMWPSVRKGEARWIFPFQHLADATFNTSLDYELAVLKGFAAPLLNTIKPDVPEYAEARRLTGILQNFMSISAKAIPGDSILRESIGGSQLSY